MNDLLTPATSTPHATLRLPADSSFLAVLRTATSGLAARLDFTLEEIEDLRIAVDEACALLITQARDGSEMECRYWLAEASLTVEVAVPSDAPRPPSQRGFAWTVLSALTTTLDSRIEDDCLVIRLSRAVERHS